ncbi:DUF305 domain-containing protein [Alteriqipengyuania flavescens]|uniref:DUF305 domain-containing protein n=1 Tax=Alteriqipengyuania flavescens TaxID=3053610 RepID=UPI0025B54822|nr:DUF305 domain-containing protein [Alteriqipengyuania flavescens]WJY19779.1 DUF305 domain-containing protein [Alteriqipengyuania flavescens]WJY25721.1 DUF305 domain-containing protein [Alteriqipengyuania flavescens]
MTTKTLRRANTCFMGAGFTIAAMLMAGTAMAQDVPIVQPGAPGAQGRALTADEATRIADTRFIEADGHFLQAMIPHHRQAVVLSELVDGRTSNDDVITIANRILAGQADEIAFMNTWLADRGFAVPAASGPHAMHAMHGGFAMEGMASAEDIARLASLNGTEFDRLFLQLMTAHHRGAITMVDELFSTPGAAYDPQLYSFTSDVKNDQSSEIERMNVLLAGLSEDPRAGLSAGFRDAGTAISNMTLLASLPKPAGFFDADNPAGLPLAKQRAMAAAEGEASEATAEDPAAGTEWSPRSPLLSFSQTDMAFQDDIMVAGNYHGFNIYRLTDDAAPQLISSVVCPGGQGDVSIAGDLLIMSVEQTRGRVDCGRQGVEGDVSAERFRGLRIFDISDLTAPVQVGQVQTCRGSHTHSIVSADADRLVIYNSGTARVRSGEELPGCTEIPGGDGTSYFSIDVIEVPVANPAAARIVRSPRVFANQETGEVAGLWTGGDHGNGTQDTYRTDQCHDITVFPAKNIAAGACSGNGILMDITDPLNPVRLDAVTDPGFAYWHSATFNNDGSVVLFTDEWGGGGRPRCQAGDRMDWGADAFYSVEGRALVQQGKFKMPAPQSDKENCVAHNGSIIPVPGRDIFVQAWYQGGISVIDFTDPANPFEIAFFDRGPVFEPRLTMGGYWSAYWYDGKIYGTEIARGLDVFELTPSEFLSQAEIDAAKAAIYPGGVFNPQTQTQVTWPQDAIEESRNGG